MNNQNQIILIIRIKKIQTIFIIVILLMAVSKDLLTHSAFKLNQDFIAKVLCINKERPKLKCDGNCYLNKELKKNNGDDRKANINFPINKQEQKINFFTRKLASNKNYYKTTNKQISKNEILYSYLIVKEFFHPPEFQNV